MPFQKKFKICLVSISLAKGGLERSCAMLSQMLTQSGHEVHIVILNDEIDYPFSGKLFNLGALKRKQDTPLKRMLRFRKLRTFLKKESFDVIIDHRNKNDFKRERFYFKYIYRGFNRIYVVHSSKKSEFLTENPVAFAKLSEQNLLNVGVSEYIENVVLRNAGIRNSATIHNAFNPSWAEEVDRFPKVLEEKKYILSYGRLDDEVKDFSFLMEAFSTSEVWKENVYLVILGDGKDKTMLQKLAASTDAASFIIFLPFTKSPFEIIKDARCVTLTSYYEGFPMVLVESLSLGTPVVSLDIVSGPSEIIQHEKNGLLIAERSLPLFSEALREICFNDILYQNLKLNTKPSVKKFSMQEISKKWNQTLQHVLSQS